MFQIFYVDDILPGANNLERVLEQKRNENRLITLLKDGTVIPSTGKVFIHNIWAKSELARLTTRTTLLLAKLVHKIIANFRTTIRKRILMERFNDFIAVLESFTHMKHLCRK